MTARDARPVRATIGSHFFALGRLTVARTCWERCSTALATQWELPEPLGSEPRGGRAGAGAPDRCWHWPGRNGRELPDVLWQARRRYSPDADAIPPSRMPHVVANCRRLWLVTSHALGYPPGPGVVPYRVHVYETQRALLAELNGPYRATPRGRSSGHRSRCTFTPRRSRRREGQCIAVNRGRSAPPCPRRCPRCGIRCLEGADQHRGVVLRALRVEVHTVGFEVLRRMRRRTVPVHHRRVVPAVRDRGDRLVHGLFPRTCLVGVHEDHAAHRPERPQQVFELCHREISVRAEFQDKAVADVPLVSEGRDLPKHLVQLLADLRVDDGPGEHPLHVG